MNETREILEEQINQAGASLGESPVDAASVNENNGEQMTDPAPEPDPYLDAPKSFKKEYAETFKTLTPEMRRYLHERESETEKGISRLQNELQSRKWLDEIVSSRQERLQKYGIKNPQEWFEQLAKVDDAMEQDPAGTLRSLVQAYGVAPEALFGNDAGSGENPQLSAFQQKLSSLEQGFSEIKQFMDAYRQQEAYKAYNSFVSAKTDSGEPKYPYLDEVRSAMRDLLSKEVTYSLEDAYNQAVWANPALREKLIAVEMENALKEKTAAAEKAKAAGFSAKGKGLEAIPQDLSTRELLERQILG